MNNGDACVWSRIDSRSLTQNASSQTLALEEKTTSFTGGVETGIGGPFRVDAALGYEKSDAKTTPADSAEGHRLQGGIVFKKAGGDIEYSAAFTGGGSWSGTKRLIGLPLSKTLAKGDLNFTFGTVSLRANKNYESDYGYMKPGVELVGTDVRMNNFRETGAGPLNLSALAYNQNYLRFKPSLEFGTEIGSTEGVWLRPSLKFAVSDLLSGDDTSFTAGFEGAPVGATPFHVGTRTDNVLGEVSGNLEVVDTSGLSLKFGYFGQFGNVTNNRR